jgi:divalent metal cation (Fe/Co/Zn/Cd) transporter
MGVTRLLRPSKLEDSWVSFAVLAAAALFEGWSWYYSLTEFNKSRGRLSLLQAVERSKDPPTFIVLFEDSAALIGIAIAAAGIAIAESFDAPVFDGLASIGIAPVLGFVGIISEKPVDWRASPSGRPKSHSRICRARSRH